MITLSIQLFWRELRNTDLRLFCISLLLAMTSVATIQLFSARVNSAIVEQGSLFIGGNQLIRQPRPISNQWHEKAAELGLKTSGYTLLTSMLAHKDELALSGVKAVQTGYPLRGKVKVATRPDQADTQINTIPRAGNIWLDTALAQQLKATPGDTIDFGVMQLLFTRYITYEPDRNATFFGFLPRAMIHHTDLKKAGVVIEGSRITHAFLYAGEKNNVSAMFDWLNTVKTEDARVIDPRDRENGIGSTLSRAENFLILASLLVTLLCGVGIALAGQRYAQLRTQNIAVYKTLGMTTLQITALIIVQLAGITLISWGIASALGWLLQEALAQFAATAFSFVLPEEFAVTALIHSLLTGVVAVCAFALPHFLTLTRIPAMHILRSSNLELRKRSALFFGAAGMLILVLLYSNSLLLSLALFSGMILCWLLASILTRVLIHAAAIKKESAWSLLLARMKKRRMHYGLQTVVFSLCILFGLMLLLVRTSLLENWQQQVPEDAINKILINIAPDQNTQVQATLKEQGIVAERYYPIVRGRFVAINETSPEQRAQETGSLEDTHKRELSITFRDTLPENNKLLQGEWWTAEKTDIPLISVEEEMASDYAIEVGDIIRFRIGASELDAQVLNIREADWQTFSPNFFVIFQPGWLDNYPHTYITGLYAPESKAQTIYELVRTFPNISVFSAEILLKQIRAVVAQVSKAIEAILLILISAGILIVVTGVRSTLDERMHEYALMRTFGAEHKEVVALVVLEFSVLGLISGSLGAVAAEAISWYLHKQLFHLEYLWNPYIWLFGPLAGVLLIGISGTVSCLPSLRIAPAALLRKLV